MPHKNKLQTAMDWKLEQFHFSEQRQTLAEGERIETLEPLACAVLAHLCRRAGEVVSRDELVDAVWQGRVVTDNAVNQIIAKLRKALGDDARNPRFIVTQSKTGYRLVAGVERIPSSQKGRFPRRPLPMLVTVGAVVSVVALLVIVGSLPEEPTARSASPLIRGGSDEYGPAVSPDGTILAYSSFEDNQLRLYLRDLQTGQAQQVEFGSGYAGGVSWSRDGDWLVYLYTESNRCQFRQRSVSDLNVSDYKVLHNCPIGSYGQAIFNHAGDKLYYAEAPEGKTPYWLFEMDLKSNVRRRLNQPVPVLGGNSEFDLHPWQDKLLVSSPDSQQWLNIYQLDLKADRFEPMFRLNEYSCCAIWSHDGARVLLQVENPYELVSFALDGSDRRVDYRGVQRIGATTRFPNGEDYVFIGAEYDADVVAFGGEGVPYEVVVNSSVEDRLPSIDPSGRWLVYVSDRSGQYKLWVKDLESNTETRVDTAGHPYYYGIAWAPNGRRLAAFGSNEIDLLAWPSGKTRKLKIPHSEIRGVSWADSDTVAFSVEEQGGWVVKHYRVDSDQLMSGPQGWAYINYGTDPADTLWFTAEGQVMFGSDKATVDGLGGVAPLHRRRFNPLLRDGVLAYFIEQGGQWHLMTSRYDGMQWSVASELGAVAIPGQISLFEDKVYVSWLMQSDSDVFRTTGQQ
ncbi:MAG: hypothetical protein DHS20C11_27030 [Lysobacteraceae bacterium]|nr:MAG: hypothetical protein DHS20C11_27030 [Xanthomonadaceae bacterium]